MKIYLSPQVNDKKIYYQFNQDEIIVTINNITDTFDFTGVPNGKLELYDDEGTLKIETELEPFPILSAEKKEGVSYVELLNWIDEDASESEKFPDWIDSEEYSSKRRMHNENG